MQKIDVIIHTILSMAAFTAAIVYFSVLGQDNAPALLTAAAVCLILYWIVYFAARNAETLQKILKVLLDLAFWGMVLYGFIGVTASSMMFHPLSDNVSYQELLEKDSAERIRIETAGGNIDGWLVGEPEPDKATVIYFGGNIENASVKCLKWTSDRSVFGNCNIVYADYPGYGKSTGYPSEYSLKNFGLKVYDYISEKYQPSKIILMGYSMGSGVANYVASKREIDGLILMAGYAEGADLFNNQVPVFYGPLKLFVTYKMESVKFAEDISVKPLLISSDTDDVVRHASSEKLSKAYPKGCDFVTIHNVEHSYYWSDRTALNSIAAYIAEHT